MFFRYFVIGTAQKIDNWLLSMAECIALSDVIKGQAIFNCATTGHVMHGKSTLVCALTGTKTQRHQAEQEKNITIRLGYANCKLYLNPSSGQVYSFPTQKQFPLDPHTGEVLQHLYTISFVDCPGHEQYMSAMVGGSKITDYAIMTIAANEKIPQAQTHQHLIALDYSGIRNDILFVLNKLDLVKERDVPKILSDLEQYLQKIGFADPTVYPISAATGENVDRLCRYLAGQVHSKIPRIISQAEKPLKMQIVRSYNVNRPDTKLEDLVGAVVGGTIETGVLSIGDQVMLRPGSICMKEGKRVIQPLVARVLSLESDHNALQYAIPGGLVGVSLSIYAGLSNNDRLRGSVMTNVLSDPAEGMCDQLTGKFRVIDTSLPGSTSGTVVFQPNMTVDAVVNGTMTVSATIVSLTVKKGAGTGAGAVRKGTMTLKLKTPVVLTPESSLAIMVDRKLVACLVPDTTSLSLPVVYPEGVDYDWKPRIYRIVDDLVPYSCEPESFSELSAHITYRSGRVKKIHYQDPELTNINKNTYITGKEFSQLVQALSGSGSDTGTASSVPAAERLDLSKVLISNIAQEFGGSSPRFNGEGNLVLNGRFRRDQFSNFLTKFCHKLLKCPSCRSNTTILSKTSGSVKRTCLNCPATTYLHTTDMSKIT